RLVGRADVVERGDVLLGHDQHVRRRLRIDVAEREAQVVLIDALRWDLTVADLAEQALDGVHSQQSTVDSPDPDPKLSTVDCELSTRASPPRAPSSAAPPARPWSA